jgi:hypothetical protein
MSKRGIRVNSSFKFSSVWALLSVAVILLVALGWFGCSEKPESVTGPGPSDMLAASPSQVKAVMEVQDRHTERLLAIDGVIGTATGLAEDGRVAVKVYTVRPRVEGIPSELEGVPVVVQVTGEVRALGKPGGHGGGGKPKPLTGKDRWPRPVPIGVSVGNVGECSSGTIGCAVTKGQQRYILSNNHVLALENQGYIGQDVVQPGRYDTNCMTNPEDVIGTLSDFEPIRFGTGTNLIDGAIALSSEEDLGCATYTAEYGLPSSVTAEAVVDMSVQKVGRTTGLTKGTVTGVNASIKVGYSSGTALFVGQIIISGRRFLSAGDSGSLVVKRDVEKNPVGLLFAGNNNGSMGVANPIDAVLDRFGVTICSGE